MSLKEFKETLLTCTTRPGSHLRPPAATVNLELQLESEADPPVVPRKPPKTSLRDQFALFEDFSKPQLPASYSAPSRLKSCPSPASPNGEHRISPEGRSASTGALLSRIKGSISQGILLQKCGNGFPKPEEKDNRAAGVEDEVLHVKKRKRAESSPSHDVDIESKVKETVATEDEGPLQDSEAGLFIQSEREGPYEPLLLWPPPGEGSSSGVQEGRVVQVPASINSRLLPHQRDGVKFLYKLYREDRGGILGDDMGLGKTIQTIALIAALLQQDGGVDKLRAARAGPLSSEAGTKETLPPRRVFLIICPTSVLQNWEQEFEAWGSFRTGIYHGANRDAILEKVESNELEVLLTSHDMFRINVSVLCAIKWEFVVVDEAHRLKNEKSQLYKACIQLNTKRRYGLTGTIMQNKYIELFNVFDWAAPGSLGPREHFMEYYGEPLKQGQRISAPERFVRIAEERKRHLVEVLSRHLLRRTKQETIGHLMRGKADNVVFCKMSDVQTHVYRRLLQSADFQLLISKDLPCSCGSHLSRVECCHRTAPDGVIWSYLHKENPEGCEWCPFCLVLPCLTKLQQVSNHLELIKPSPKDDLEKQKKDEEFASVALGEDAVLVGGLQQNESFMGLSDAQHCGKMRALERLLGTWLSNGDKVLLFSYSVKMLDILDKFMIRKGFSFCRLDGSTPMGARQTLVDEFNNSPSKQVFLISTRAGGLGLNLASANRVVIFDPNWNPAQDLQAQDRSFRFGQRRHVTVYRLLAAGSIEELVYSRQIYKQQLFNIGVNGTFEKRYFEGVQDSKLHKGELFGISNLFRDLLDTVFTSDIIDKHDERLTRIHSKGTVISYPKEQSQLKLVDEQLMSSKIYVRSEEAQVGDVSTLETTHILRSELEEDDIEDKKSSMSGGSLSDIGYTEETQNNSEKKYEHLLEDAGVVYAHRNEKVVNLGVPLQKHGSLKKKEHLQHRKIPKKKILPQRSGSYGDHKSLASSVPVLDKVHSVQEASTVHGFPVASQEGEVGANGRGSKEQEKRAKFEAMDETTKWLLSASGFSLHLINDLN